MNGTEELFISEDYIKLDMSVNDEAVMHIGEKDISLEMGNLVCRNGGDILELGFGMNISADAIQKNSNISSHTIIETHPKIYRNALKWAKDKKNTNIICGDWVNVLPKINKKFDGILHDTHLDDNIPVFLETCKHLCKKNCIIVFYFYNGSDKSFFNIKKVSLKDEDILKIPYRDYFDFKNYELYYTFFDGKNFVKEL